VNGLAAEAQFQFSQDFNLGYLFEGVLKDAASNII
jgi:hypothetical protein